MESVSRGLLTVLINASWQILAIAAASTLGAWLLRRAQARVRHRIWTAALVLCLLVPLTSLIPRGGSDGVTIRIDSVVARSSGAPMAAYPRAFPIVLQIWMGLVLLRMIGLASSWHKARRLHAAAASVDLRAELLPIVARCHAVLGLNPVPILAAASIAGPVTLGWRRPVVLLPESLLATCSTETFATMLAHELVHVWRRDYFWHVLAEIACLPLFFHPAVLLIKRRVAATREMACDEVVAELMLDRFTYARSLIAIAQQIGARRQPAYTLGLFDAGVLEERIMKLTTQIPPIGRRLGRILLASAVGLMAAVTITSSAFSFSLAQADDQVHKIGGDVKAPKLLLKIEPAYTPEARDAKIEGSVTLQVEISPKGMADKVQVLKSLDPGLDKNAMAAVKEWKFEPGEKSGKPVRVRATIEVNFRLK